MGLSRIFASNPQIVRSKNWTRTASSVICATVLSGCPAPTESKSADPSRSISPVPACVRNLPPAGNPDYARQLPEDEYWGLLVPTWKDSFETTGEVLACNGQPLFLDATFDGVQLDPAARMEGRITYGGGANQLKVVWLRSHSSSQGQEAGPLALVRVVGHHAEVYGVTSFRGDPQKVRFDLERLGGEVVVTAITDGCSGAQGDCDTILQVYRPQSGRLDKLADIGLRRVRQGQGLEPGVSGPLAIQFVSSPEYTPNGIALVEEFSVSDGAGRALRRAQVERAYMLNGLDVVETSSSLWQRMYLNRVPEAAAGAEKKTPPKSKKKTPPKSKKRSLPDEPPALTKQEAPSTSSMIAVDRLK